MDTIKQKLKAALIGFAKLSDVWIRKSLLALTWFVFVGDDGRAAHSEDLVVCKVERVGSVSRSELDVQSDALGSQPPRHGCHSQTLDFCKARS